MEFFICDTADLDDPDGVVTQECFNKYPLTRADDDGVNSPIDPNHPGRYYVDPECREYETEQYKEEKYWRAGGGYVMTMNYQLPADLTCERCVLQMWYCECCLSLLLILLFIIYFITEYYFVCPPTIADKSRQTRSNNRNNH